MIFSLLRRDDVPAEGGGRSGGGRDLSSKGNQNAKAQLVGDVIDSEGV